MTTYVLTYHGQPADFPEDPTAVQAIMDAWGSWYGTIGENLVDGGNPFGAHTAIGPDGDIDLPSSLAGYTVVKADSLDDAKEIAKGCPVLAAGSSVQISECLEM